ncbi:MAG: PQQ-binding-like beta-propeller repeat protein, partial [Candidatus Acidiferrales bacterium]
MNTPGARTTRMIAAMALVAALVMPSAAAAQNWPAFRGNNSSGVAEGPAIPSKWDVDSGENILWKREIPGFGHSGPIVWGDLVFVTTAVSADAKDGIKPRGGGLVVEDKSEFEWRVYALNRKTGEVVWERTAHKGVPRSKRHPQSSQASSTPVTNGNVVVAYFGTEGLYAYDLKGNLLWKRDMGAINTSLYFDPDQVYGTATSPVIYR